MRLRELRELKFIHLEDIIPGEDILKKATIQVDKAILEFKKQKPNHTDNEFSEFMDMLNEQIKNL